MTIPEPDMSRRVRRAENDILSVYGLLEGIQRTVDQHTVTLAHHSALLNNHTVQLHRLETRLDEHGGMLKEILRRLPAAS
jgi:hypothetical protein